MNLGSNNKNLKICTFQVNMALNSEYAFVSISLSEFKEEKRIQAKRKDAKEENKMMEEK